MMRFKTALVLAFVALSGTGTLAAAQAGRPPQAPPPDLTALDIEQLMQLEVVFAASKRNQNPREVASVVSVVTAAEIRQHGYRTLADILKSLPSFFISDDRNYSYVGVRGFMQPGDFSSRVLLLLNGLRTNDNVYDQALVGEEFIVDVDLIDRVEVVRGPSAAIYGSSAFFAVINVVTKRGGDLDGAEISGSGASFGTYAGRASYGTKFGTGVEVLASASIGDGAGASRLYFPEFDDPSTNGGIAEHADGEGFGKLFVSVAKGRFSFEASHVTRKKGIPTASYATAFNDSRTRTRDQVTLASLTYDRSSTKGSASARLHSGRYHYYGEYAYDATAPNQDMAFGEWWGIDLDATRSISGRNLLTVGLEYRDNYRQDQKNYTPEPYSMWVNDYNQSQRLGVFAQNELTLFKPLILYTGVRQDWYDTFGAATSPRLGLIYNPGAATTLKLMLGRAFRAPNEYEFHYGGGTVYKLNPLLGPERIETLELAAEHRIGHGLRVTASAFQNHIADLITLQLDPADDLLVFQNVGRIRSKGLELGLVLNRGRGVTGSIGATWQETFDRETGIELRSAPERMIKLQLAAPLVKERLSTAIDAQYVGARGTLAGAEAKEYVVANLSVLAPRLFRGIETSATVYNVFDTKYGNPGAQEHLQDIIQQDGRSFRVKATLRF